MTGANGFIGKNLILGLKNHGFNEILAYDIDTGIEMLDEYCQKATFVFHLAGVNRPKEQAEFAVGNVDFTAVLLDKLKKWGNTCPVLLSSSIQAKLDNPYGVSKRASEELLLKYSEETGIKVLIYRLHNVFGKWCRPNYNSVVASFCYNIARDMEITVHDTRTRINLIYIDDVVEEMLHALSGKENRKKHFCYVEPVYSLTLGEIVKLLYSFRNSREERTIPNVQDCFTKKLYSTYLSYLADDDFAYELNMHTDARGSFTEFLKTSERGQVSVNISKPGITKGNHWHNTKIEKFLVVSGIGVIRFRRIETGEIIEYNVSGDKLEVVDIPPGYTHNIENLGESDLVTVMWANEVFCSDKPDTYFLEV